MWTTDFTLIPSLLFCELMNILEKTVCVFGGGLGGEREERKENGIKKMYFYFSGWHKVKTRVVLGCFSFLCL